MVFSNSIILWLGLKESVGMTGNLGSERGSTKPLEWALKDELSSGW